VTTEAGAQHLGVDEYAVLVLVAEPRRALTKADGTLVWDGDAERPALLATARARAQAAHGVAVRDHEAAMQPYRRALRAYDAALGAHQSAVQARAQQELAAQERSMVLVEALVSWQDRYDEFMGAASVTDGPTYLERTVTLPSGERFTCARHTVEQELDRRFRQADPQPEDEIPAPVRIPERPTCPSAPSSPPIFPTDA
jgi:hypothetical protein